MRRISIACVSKKQYYVVIVINDQAHWLNRNGALTTNVLESILAPSKTKRDAIRRMYKWLKCQPKMPTKITK